MDCVSLVVIVIGVKEINYQWSLSMIAFSKPRITEPGPKDIYNTVLDTLLSSLSLDAKKGNGEVQEYAKYWVDILKDHPKRRGITKRVVMCSVYSLSTHGFYAYTREWIAENREPNTEDLYKHDTYLCKRVIEAVKSTISKAYEVMDWIKELTSMLTEHGHSLEFTLPSGFHMESSYTKSTTKKVRTKTQGHIHTISYKKGTGALMKGKSINACVPNFIHSLDSCILYDIIEDLPKAIPVSLVHDSIFFRAADVNIIYNLVRESYINVFSNDLLLQLKEQNQTRTGIELPNPPDYGAIDLNEIRESSYIWM